MTPNVPRCAGILETALYVADLDRSEAFYRALFGFERFLRDERMCSLGVPGGAVLLLFRLGGSAQPSHSPVGTIPPHDGRGTQHLCFAIPHTSLEEWEAHLAGREIAVESRLSWPQGGTSLYFRDPDGHSLEVATPGLWPNR